jgi:hypothetical protein
MNQTSELEKINSDRRGRYTLAFAVNLPRRIANALRMLHGQATAYLIIRPMTLMRVLVIGAGASIEEAKRANAPEEFWPPTIANFAKKMWDGPVFQFCNYWLHDYLTEHGIDPGKDPTSVFIELAKAPESLINLERLFEYCWVNKGKKLQDDWENLIYHGILKPLSFTLNQAFYENGVGVKQLSAGKLVSSKFEDGDLAAESQ